MKGLIFLCMPALVAFRDFVSSFVHVLVCVAAIDKRSVQLQNFS